MAVVRGQRIAKLDQLAGQIDFGPIDRKQSVPMPPVSGGFRALGSIDAAGKTVGNTLILGVPREILSVAASEEKA